MNELHEAALSQFDGVVDEGITRVEATALAVLNRSEIETQMDAAHRYPRSIKRFVQEALTLATLTREVAESCIYGLPRGGKIISGPSVRLAEICGSAYGNLHVGARVVDVTDREVVAQGVALDLEKNLRVTVEARRRITNKAGKRYDDDMITMTGNAAGSIALRNAIFRVVPRAYVDMIYSKVREVAVGNASTLAARRQEVVTRLQKIGVPVERIFPRVGVKAIEDVGLDELEVLIGLGTAIKNGDQTIDAAFPPVDTAPAATKKLEEELRAEGAAKPAQAPTPASAHAVPPSPPEPAKVASHPSETEKTVDQSAADPPALGRESSGAASLPDWADPKKTDGQGRPRKRAREPGEEG